MPPIMRYESDPNTEAARLQEELFAHELRERQPLYGQRWDYYYGNHRKHLKPDNTNTDDNLTINLVELGIDKGNGRLMGTSDNGTIKGPDFDVAKLEEPTPQPAQQPNMMQRAADGVKRVGRAMMGTQKQQPEESEENKWLRDFWEANHKSIVLHDIALNGAICGHVFIKIVPDGVPGMDDPAKRFPRLIPLNPGNVTVFWDWNDIDRVLVYRIQYGGARLSTLATQPAYRQDIVRAVDDSGADEGYWIIRDFEQVPSSSQWKLVREDTWQYEWPPIVEWKNLPRPNEHYGLDDVRKNPNLNDGLNFTASNMQRIIKYHAQPTTIITGGSADDLTEIGGDRLWAIDAADAKVYNVEMQSDLKSSLEFISMLRSAYFDGVRELDPATVKDKVGTLTNFGLRVLYGDALQKTGTKRLLYGHGLRQVCCYALELGGFGANRKVTDKWPDPLPTDPLTTAQALQIDRQNGLSQDTYLERRGFDPEVEAQNREQEIGEQALQQTLGQQGALLNKFQQMRGGNGQPNGANGASNGNANGRTGGMDNRGY